MTRRDRSMISPMGQLDDGARVGVALNTSDAHLGGRSQVDLAGADAQKAPIAFSLGSAQHALGLGA